MAEPAQVRQRGGEDVGVGGGGFGQRHIPSAATLPQHRPGRSRLVGSIAAVGCVLLLGCGSGEATTDSTSTSGTTTVPLCSAINSGEVTIPADGNCRPTPTCAEVDAGAELPPDGKCLATEP